MSHAKTRWAILGAADIARKNWKAILNSGNGQVQVVACRDRARGERFVQECQAEAPFPVAPRVVEGYAEAVNAPDVDAVYIPLPTGLRKEWVLKAAAAGKHVICEKPCSPNLEDLREITAACERHGVQFLDGVMFMHSRRLQRMREILDDATSVGQIRRVQTAFSFCAPPAFFTGNIRSHSSLEPHGCLGDLGWYCLRFSLWALNWRLPRAVSGQLLSQSGRPDSPDRVPTAFSGELFYDGDLSAGFFCAFIAELQQWAVVSGDRGYLRLNDFVLPYTGTEMGFETHQATFDVKGCSFQMKPGIRRHTVTEPSDGHPDAQETQLFRNFARQIQSGRLNADWPRWAVQTQTVMEACLASARNGGRLVTLPPSA